MNLIAGFCGRRFGLCCVWIGLAMVSLAHGQGASLSGSLSGSATASASRAAAVLDSMPQAKKIDQAALSPDGGQVAYVMDGEITLRDLGNGGSHPITVEGKLPLRELAWSADSRQLAFLAALPGDVPSAQLWTF